MWATFRKLNLSCSVVLILILVSWAVVCEVTEETTERTEETRNDGKEDSKFVRSRKIEIKTSQSFAVVNYTAEGIPFITAKNDMELFYTQGNLYITFFKKSLHCIRKTPSHSNNQDILLLRIDYGKWSFGDD
jgi:hypothetical protein